MSYSKASPAARVARLSRKTSIVQTDVADRDMAMYLSVDIVSHRKSVTSGTLAWFQLSKRYSQIFVSLLAPIVVTMIFILFFRQYFERFFRATKCNLKMMFCRHCNFAFNISSLSMEIYEIP